MNVNQYETCADSVSITTIDNCFSLSEINGNGSIMLCLLSSGAKHSNFSHSFLLTINMTFKIITFLHREYIG